MEDQDEIVIDGDIVNETFSSRAPKVKLNPVRYLFRDSTLFFIFKIFLFFIIVGGLIFIYWTKIFGGILIIFGVIIFVSILRFLNLRKTEYKNAVLSPGIVIAQEPLTVLILSDMNCGGPKEPIWAVTKEICRSLKPLSSEIGTRIPCVTAFQGSGFGGSWDRMVSSPLTNGTGSKKRLHEALSRLNDEDEWQVLILAIENEKFPELGKTLRL